MGYRGTDHLLNNGKGIEYSSKYDGNNFENDLVQVGLNKIREYEVRWIK